VPGHEVVGRVDKRGAGAGRFEIGERVGVGWIHSSSGKADENLSPRFQATGRDVNGGYAEYVTVLETYAYPIPTEFTDVEAAPLLCAGGVGYRSLRLAGIKDGQNLGIAAAIPLRPQVQTYRLEEANRALLELQRGPVRGAKVLLIA